MGPHGSLLIWINQQLWNVRLQRLTENLTFSVHHEPEHGRPLNLGGPWASAQVSPYIKAAIQLTFAFFSTETKHEIVYVMRSFVKHANRFFHIKYQKHNTELTCVSRSGFVSLHIPTPQTSQRILNSYFINMHT